MPSLPAPAPAVAERLAKLIDRTARLHRLTAHLSTALVIEQVAQIVVDEGTSALEAHSGALWQLDAANKQLVLLRSSNYSAQALASIARLPLDPTIPIADAVVRGEPVWLSSRKDYDERYPVSAARTRAMELAGYSVAALPVVIDGNTVGVMALTFLNERGFDEDERKYLGFLALHCSQGFQRARLYASQANARREAEIAKERAQFLLKASALLGSSLDYEETLANVAAIAVPNIGDWCAVELVDDDGSTKQVAVAHIDPAKVELARELRRRYPPNPNRPTGVPHILRTGVSELHEEITDELLAASAVDDDHLGILRDLGLRSAMAVPIKDRDVVVGVISFASARLERRYSSDDLLMAEQLGERAGAAITNAKLYTTAREAIRARDEFMLVAGHELRTPLAALSLHHEALVTTRDGTPLEKVRERGVKLKAQSERLIRLVEDLLDVSRLSAGRLALELDDVDLGALVREIMERLHDDFERAHSPVTTELVEVHGRWDKARLDQVITNLATNAIKYGKGAPIEIRVSQEGRLAKLVVADHGIGIAAHDQMRIFKRFERAVSSRKFGGLGLGLWITTQLVQAHGGAITVDSQLGAGATFTVLLPLTPSIQS